MAHTILCPHPIHPGAFSSICCVTRLCGGQVLLYCPKADVQLLAKAYYFAEKAHEGQKRRSGEPYFVHPVLGHTPTSFLAPHCLVC